MTLKWELTYFAGLSFHLFVLPKGKCISLNQYSLCLLIPEYALHNCLARRANMFTLNEATNPELSFGGETV